VLKQQHASDQDNGRVSAQTIAQDECAETFHIANHQAMNNGVATQTHYLKGDTRQWKK
jgi:hypothetical protein